MTIAPEQPETDSAAYAAGMIAYENPEYVPCPYEPGSRAAQLWYDGRSDAEHAGRAADMVTMDDGD